MAALREGQTHTNSTESSPSQSQTQAVSPSSTGQPPAKRPRLKLKVRAKLSNNPPGDTIAVSRPRRVLNSRSRYSQDTETRSVVPVQTQQPPKQSSSGPSSGLSSLSSAPSSPREESPFQDLTPLASARDDYGDLMAYYIAGGDDDDESKKKIKSKSKPKSKQRTKPKLKADIAKPQKQLSPPPPPQPPPATKPPQKTPPSHVQQHGLSSYLQQHAPPQQPSNLPPQMPRPPAHHALPPYPPGAPAPPGSLPQGHHNVQPGFHAPGPHLQRQRTMPLPEPIIQFMDVQPDPKPTTPDTIAVMIGKLEDLSSALTNFGGVPGILPTPPPEISKLPPKKPPQVLSNPLDGFLSLFGEDEDDESSEDHNPFDYTLANPGVSDSPLIYGIQFIQNALRSWAQQRMTHQVTQQWNTQQAEQFQRQMQAQRRGPGRPRQYDTDQPVQPIIQMALADTPEGVAIKAFQSVLDSKCLQVNAILPADLSRALRHLYMQIDHLINQGSKSDNSWQCMSYSAQIQAHKTRIEKWREAQAKHQEEMARQQQLSQQQVIGQMGLQPHQAAPLTAEQIQHQHAMDLERRRSIQHAAQQPYNASQHLHPLQLGSPPSGHAKNFASLSQQDIPHLIASYAPPVLLKPNIEGTSLRPVSTNGRSNGSLTKAIDVPYNPSVPRTSRSDGEHTAYASGAGVASRNDKSSSGSCNTVDAPYSRPHMAGTRHPRTNGTTVQTGDAASPIEIDGKGDTVMSDAPSNPQFAGSTASNVPILHVNRPLSVSASSSPETSPGTIRVAMRRTKGSAPVSTSSTSGVGSRKASKRSGFPRTGAVVVEH